MNSKQITGSLKIVAIYLLAISFAVGAFSCKKSDLSQNDIFWTKDNSPEIIGRMVIDDLFTRDDFMMYITDFWTGIHYAEACTGFGAARLAGLLNDSLVIDKLCDRYMKVIEDSLHLRSAHVDANVYGILPLELYMQGGEEKFLQQGLELADGQWEDTLPNGLTSQVRYWVDDIWMIVSLQVQAYRATGNEIYLERAAKVTDSYLKKLQRPNGLFYHGENSPFFWGRGNGWGAVGMAELLSELSASSPYYTSILDGYKKMMNALLEYQAEDGMWRQLIDKEEAWNETSATAMFGYAVTVGVKKGLLSEDKFTPVYQKAWLSLVEYINEEGKITEVCAGTGKGDNIDYYLNRPRIIGDFHGQAPVLWFAYSLLASY
jgi:unsaturated rhamnogalacturonyl hydrolase